MIYPELYIIRVRNDLNMPADSKGELLTDDTIVQGLKNAYRVLRPWESTVDTTEKNELFIDCVVALGSYYIYTSYTILAERGLGEEPETSKNRINSLKEKAYHLIRQIAPINKDLEFKSDEVKIQGFYSGLTHTILDRDYNE